MITWKQFIAAANILLLGLVSASLAAANSVLINADNSSGALCSVAAPCGTITVTGTTTLTVTITLNSPYGVFGNDAFGFNVQGPSTGVAITDFSNPGFSQGTAGNEDGWGNYEFRVSG